MLTVCLACSRSSRCLSAITTASVSVSPVWAARSLASPIRFVAFGAQRHARSIDQAGGLWLVVGVGFPDDSCLGGANAGESAGGSEQFIARVAVHSVDAGREVDGDCFGLLGFGCFGVGSGQAGAIPGAVTPVRSGSASSPDSSPVRPGSRSRQVCLSRQPLVPSWATGQCLQVTRQPELTSRVR